MSDASGTVELEIYTDGACSGNPGPGGWAAVLVRAGEYEELGGREEHTTNNRMEMRAALEGLRRARPGESAHVVTDSRYLHDGISKWIHAWKRRGWRKADGGDVLNRDLWEELDRLCRRPGTRVTWEHVRGHAGHGLNERCDQIATGFARGTPPELCRGGGVPPSSRQATDPFVKETRSYPVYVSVVDGDVRLHPTWSECEARVTGVKGARHRKARTPRELDDTLEAWGVSPTGAGLGAPRREATGRG